MHSPTIHSVEGRYVLTGVEPSPVPLWNIDERDGACRDNIDRALSLDPATTPIFIGADHASLLKARWPVSRPAILVEKSSLLTDCLRRSGAFPPLPPNIHVVIGQFGLCTPQYSRQYLFNFFYQELGYLAFRLLSLPDVLWRSYKLFILPFDQMESEYLMLLEQVIYLMGRAKLFHRENEGRYQGFREKVRQGNCLMVRYPSDEHVLEKYWRDLLCREPHSVFAVGDYGDPYNYMSLFDRIHSYPNASAFLTPASAQPYQDKAGELLDHLESHPPARILWRNRSALTTLEDILFSEEMIRRLQIPAYSFFVDWMTHSAFFSEGGWSLNLHLDLWPSRDRKILTTEPATARVFAPADCRVGWHPCCYYQVGEAPQPPLPDPGQMERDVALVNNVRNATQKDEFVDELYAIVLRHAPGDPASALHRFFVFLKRYLAESPDIGTSYYVRSFLNIMDWKYYHKVRFQRMMELVSRLSGKRYTVYGGGWEGLVPPGHYAGLVEEKELFRVYRTSRVTIDATVSSCYQYPHPNIIECFDAGGLCLTYAPCFDYQAPGMPEFLTREALPYCSSTEDLLQQLDYYLNHWSERNQAITVFQETWLKKIRRGEFHSESLDHLIRNDIPMPSRLPETITGNLETDLFLMRVTVGYFTLASGFPKAALEVWKDAVLTYDVPDPDVVRRGVSESRRIGDFSLENFFLLRTPVPRRLPESAAPAPG